MSATAEQSTTIPTTGIDPRRAMQHARLDAAVAAAGQPATMKVIETFMADMPSRAKARRATRHAAFELLSARRQRALERGDQEELSRFVRELLNALLVQHDRPPVGKNADDRVFRAAVVGLRNADRPRRSPSGEGDRARREARRHASRAGRPSGPVGQGGQKAALGRGETGGNTRNARKRRRRASGH